MSDNEGLADALKFVAETAQEATDKTIQIITNPNEKAGTYLLAKQDGTFEQRTAAPGWLFHAFRTPMELRNFIDNDAESKTAAIFVADENLTYVPDHADARNRFTCKMIAHEQFTLISALAGKTFGQREFISLLRIALRGCISEGSNLLALMRELKFNTDAAGQGSIQHGQESLGRGIIAKVTGVDAIPQELFLSTQVYENWDPKVNIACAIEILTQEQQFRLIPYPGEIRRAKDGVLLAIQEQVAKNDRNIPAYLGTV